MRTHLCINCQAVFSKPIALTHHWLRWTCASPISDLWGSRGSLNFDPPFKKGATIIFHVEIFAAGIMWRKKSTFHLLKIAQPRETNRKSRRTKTKADKRRPARIPRILPLSTILKIEELSKKEISDPRVLSQIWMKRIRFSMSPVKTSKISTLICLGKGMENIYHSTFVGNIIGMNENKLHDRKFSATCMPYTHSWQWLTGSPSLLIWKVSTVFKSQRVHCVHLYVVLSVLMLYIANLFFMLSSRW